MTATVPTQLPSTLIAGDTWSWMRGYGDYPAGTWTATVYFENSGQQFNASATASGTDHLFTVAAATSAGKKAGRYRWWIRVTDGSTVATIEDGWTDVKPDPGATGTRDHRSAARRQLDALEAFLEGNASTAQASMQLGSRSISRWSLPELFQWQDRLRQEVRTEERAEAAGIGRNMKVRFNRG